MTKTYILYPEGATSKATTLRLGTTRRAALGALVHDLGYSRKEAADIMAGAATMDGDGELWALVVENGQCPDTDCLTLAATCTPEEPDC